MINKSEIVGIELICVIVNFGLGSKIIKMAKLCGINGATATLGKGTINNRLLDFVGLSDVRKEVVYMVANKSIAYQALEKMNKEFAFNRPNHGIVFTTSICDVLASNCFKCQNLNDQRGEDKIMYNAITIIVDKGNGEDVVASATEAGAKGGTIINARGSGVHEKSKLFLMDIEPEKEIVIILSETEMTEQIVSAIRRDLKIDEPGNGIIYIQDVNKTYGIYK